MLLPLTLDYVYSDEHAEIIYKAIKRLRLKKLFYDRVGFILFNYIFGEGLLEEIETRTILFEEVLVRHGLKEFIGHELILNL